MEVRANNFIILPYKQYNELRDTVKRVLLPSPIRNRTLNIGGVEMKKINQVVIIIFTAYVLITCLQYNEAIADNDDQFIPKEVYKVSLENFSLGKDEQIVQFNVYSTFCAWLISITSIPEGWDMLQPEGDCFHCVKLTKTKDGEPINPSYFNDFIIITKYNTCEEPFSTIKKIWLEVVTKDVKGKERLYDLHNYKFKLDRIDNKNLTISNIDKGRELYCLSLKDIPLKEDEGIWGIYLTLKNITLYAIPKIMTDFYTTAGNSKEFEVGYEIQGMHDGSAFERKNVPDLLIIEKDSSKKNEEIKIEGFVHLLYKPEDNNRERDIDLRKENIVLRRCEKDIVNSNWWIKDYRQFY
ncbi:hypothetical protein MCHI_001992 [Candidatus Magnetoovum chiemensis]|nr:hypothetical protein MCHI_001992 [Candidatus Magnetoovum chiemensis]